MQANQRGMFIVIEGMDGSGKSTQVAKLAERLNHAGSTTVRLEDPGSNPSGLALRKVLLDKDIPLTPVQQLLLFTAARIGTAEQIREAINAGVNVIADRWVLSTFVYQGVMGDIPMGTIDLLHNAFVDIDPDVYIVLDVPVGVARNRLCQSEATKDRFESRDDQWWEDLRTAYQAVADSLDLRVVLSFSSPDTIAEQILKVCKESPEWPADLADL